MSAAGDAFARVAADLKAAETVLEFELSKLEAWRALRQLEERESRGDGLHAIDAERLKAVLHTRLDRQAPQWRALAAIREAITQLTAPPLEVKPAAQVHSGNVSKSEGPAKVRVKIKAATLAMASTGGSELASVRASTRSGPAEPAPDVATSLTPDTADRMQNPGRSEASAPVEPPVPAPERRHLDLHRIRKIEEVLQQPPGPAPAAGGAARDRFGGVLRWSMLDDPPPAPVEEVHSVPERDPSVAPAPSIDGQPDHRPVRGFAATVASSLPVRTLATRDAEIRGDAAAGGFGESRANADVIPVPPLEPPVTSERLADIEAGLDELVGARPPQPREAHRAPYDEADVDEADVEIVRERRSADVEQPPSRQTAAPVALSIRLKEPEHTAEFDAANYEAYRTDIEEAEVEIVRPGGNDASGQTRLEPAPGPASARRGLKE